MKKIILVVTAAISLLTATGQPMQYRDNYLLPYCVATGCVNYDIFTTVGNGWSLACDGLYAKGWAQPFFIDSGISVKGIAAIMHIQQPEAKDKGLMQYLQIRDSTLTQVFAEIRYDTLTIKSFVGPDSGFFFGSYIEELFDRSIFIQGSKFYIVAICKNPMNVFSSAFIKAVAPLQIIPDCYNKGDFPLLVWGKEKDNSDSAWLSAYVYDSLYYVQGGTIPPENHKEVVPIEMFVFPILGVIANDTTDTSGHNSVSPINLEKYTYLYPNPTTNEITFASSVVLTKVELFNMAGLKVHEQEIKANNITLNVSAFAKGTYVARLHTRQGVVCKRFIVR